MTSTSTVFTMPALHCSLDWSNNNLPQPTHQLQITAKALPAATHRSNTANSACTAIKDPAHEKRPPHTMPITYPSSSSTSTLRQRPRNTQSPPSTSSISSYPSSMSSSSDVSSDDEDEDEEYERALIQEEWNESLRQMQMLFSLVLMPFFGRWWGRRWSYWGESKFFALPSTTKLAVHRPVLAYERYLAVGLTKKFWGLA